MSDIGQHQQSTLTVPLDGGAATAAGVRANDNAVATKHNNHDNDYSIHILTFANLAAFTSASSRTGALACALDTRLVYVSDGSSWTSLGYRVASTALTAADIEAGTFPAGTFIFPGLTISGAKLTAAASASGYASINLPHGTAPSSPANGDIWTTTAGLYARINSGTVGPVIGTGSAASLATLALTGTGPVVDGSAGTFSATPAMKFPSAADVAVSVRASSGSIASGGNTTITWSTEVADPKSLSTVGAGSTTTAFSTGAYGGLWVVAVDFTAVVAGSESAALTITGGIAGNVQLLGSSAPGTGSSHFLVLRAADSTAVTLQVASTGGSGGITWGSVRLTAVRIW